VYKLLSLILVTCLLSSQEVVFRSDVTVVKVDARVNNNGQPIPGLTKDDFRVFDNGAPQPIEYFGHDTEPVHIVLLLDLSGSMYTQVVKMSNVARQALAALGPDDDVAIMFFGGSSMVAQEFTKSASDAAAVIGTARRIQPISYGTTINKCVMDAIAYMRKATEGKPGRRAIVILTDNEGLNYQMPDDQVLEALDSADTVFNAIVTDDAKPPVPPRAGYVNPDFTPSNVFALAAKSAGDVLKMDRGGDAFQDMLERIRRRYSLHYRAPAGEPKSTRTIRIELSETARAKYPKAEVAGRNSYKLP
jgi:VWFA-related protein